MKNIYTLSFLIINMLMVSAQTTYHPLPESDATWVFGVRSMCFGYSSINEIYDVRITGDTVIGNQTYHQLRSRFMRKNSGSECPAWIHGYIGSFRQNVNEQKVYFIAPDSTDEKLLYDFTLQVGDTLKGYLSEMTTWQNTPQPFIISSIDTVMVGGSQRRRWNFSTGYNLSIIEGIGSSYGLVRIFPVFNDFDEIEIMCFEQNNTSLYPDTSLICQTINTERFKSEENEIRVYPNPFSELTQIENLPKNATVKIIKPTGELVFQDIVESSGNIVIQRNTLKSSGMYMLHIYHEASLLRVKKLIVL